MPKYITYRLTVSAAVQLAENEDDVDYLTEDDAKSPEQQRLCRAAI